MWKRKSRKQFCINKRIKISGNEDGSNLYFSSQKLNMANKEVLFNGSRSKGDSISRFFHNFKIL